MTCMIVTLCNSGVTLPCVPKIGLGCNQYQTLNTKKEEVRLDTSHFLAMMKFSLRILVPRLKILTELNYFEENLIQRNNIVYVLAGK